MIQDIKKKAFEGLDLPTQVHAVSIDVPLLSCQKALRKLVSLGYN